MPKYLQIIFLTLLSVLSSGFTLGNGVSVYYKNFVRHADGEFCEHLPPAATFTAYLNNDQSKILIENAPRWEIGADPNITGMGVFGVELGNFTNPPVTAGDSVFVRFTCNQTHQQGTISTRVDSIPWYYFPGTLTLTPEVNLPDPPQNVSLDINSYHQRVIQWNPVSGVRYSVYRRMVRDTVFNGQSRMLYFRLAHNITAGSFIDTTTAPVAHGYIVIPESGGVYGSHSREVVDYPAIPTTVEAAVAYSNPFQVAVTWIQPGDTAGLSYRIYRSLSPGVAIDSVNLIGETVQQFWLDSQVMQGQTYYYRVVAANQIGVPGYPSDEASVTVEEFAGGMPDLDILHISRSPKYPRLDIVYDPPGYNPHPRPGTENVKHYPDPGEMMTYTAAIRNSGGGTVQGFQVDWYADSLLIHSATYGHIFPRQRIFSAVQRPWPQSPEYIRCEVQPLQTVNELTLQNNSLTIRSNALSFRFHAEKNILDLFETHQNPMSSYSFEDWAQVQVQKLNQFFSQAIYPPFAPGGVPEFVFLDTVNYYNNGALPAGGTHAPHSLLWDGQWGFTGDPNAINYFLNIVLGQQNGMDWALLHELGHQLGLIDLYNQDVQESELQVIEPRTGQKPPLTPIAWDVLYYSSRSNYLMHTNFQNGLSDHSAGGLLRNLSKRRGYFGDYLADIPGDNTLHIKYPNGAPIKNAEVRVYQQQDNVIPNTVKFSGQTDWQGDYSFPHVTDTSYAGGIPVANPFSSIHSPAPNVVGTNSVLFIRVAKGDSVGYKFLDVCDFNAAYWSGDSSSATYQVNITRWFNIPAAGAESASGAIPATFGLKQNYPNPFNPSTLIRYQLPKPAEVRLIIYDVTGQRVRRLIKKRQQPGKYAVTWDGRNEQGIPVASGIYLYRLVAGDFTAVRKMILIR